MRRKKRKTGHEPYINHLLRVAEGASRAGLSEDGIIAALLHDAVEDTSVGLDKIRDEFGERVAELVHLMTQWWDDHASQEIKKSEKPKYYAAIAKDKEAVHIKLLDRADNLNDMTRMLPMAKSWAERYLKRSEEEIALILPEADNEVCRLAYENSVEGLRRALKKR